MSEIKEKNINGYVVRIVPPSKKDSLLSENDKEMDRRAEAAVQAAIDRAKICKKPIAKYDTITHKAYIEYPDGHKEYAE